MKNFLPEVNDIFEKHFFLVGFRGYAIRSANERGQVCFTTEWQSEGSLKISR